MTQHEATARPWVYVLSEPNLWTTGFYGPNEKWNPDTDHDSPAKAQERVRWLNGGNSNAHDKMLAALEAVEWALSVCTLCSRIEDEGHAADCQLDEAIAAGRGREQG